ncbi:MAG: 5-methyltetrahydropteroyltriglutamate--homocysteine S-methyltransferase [Pseudomonadota bacterium]
MNAPFRADQVGSLLKPLELVNARAKFKRGEISAAERIAVEDAAVREVVARQEEAGLKSITDGELRRDYWHLDFLSQLVGVTLVTNEGPAFKGLEESQPPIATVTGKIGYAEPVQLQHWKFLHSATRQTAKVTLPAPGMLHLRGGRKGISTIAYPDLAEFWADAAAAYRKVIAAFAAAGCRYLQLDDVGFAYLCDPKFRESCRANGDDPATLAATYAHAINESIRDRPKDMKITMHTCRGNFRSSWVASGGYEPVAEALFSADIDGFFMEFDSERAGGFEPLRFLPKGSGKRVVLGLLTSKSGVLESKDDVKRRIDEATKYVPLEQLCLSPQCGFSSTHHGNDLTAEQQWAKLRLTVEIANEVWGES